jgi:hypothetical protein
MSKGSTASLPRLRVQNVQAVQSLCSVQIVPDVRTGHGESRSGPSLDFGRSFLVSKLHAATKPIWFGAQRSCRRNARGQLPLELGEFHHCDLALTRRRAFTGEQLSRHRLGLTNLRSHFIADDRFFRIAESLRSWRIRRIPAGSEVFIEAIEDLHILRGDFKVEDIGIFEDASTIGRFGNYHQSALQSPADEDLCC